MKHRKRQHAVTGSSAAGKRHASTALAPLPPPPSRPRVRARFDAALTTDENREHWSYADSLSAGAAYDPATRRTLRNRSRYEAANNSYCNGMLWTLATDTIGTGPQLAIQTQDATAQAAGMTKRLASAVELLFWKWCVAAGIFEKFRLMRMAKARDGESFATFVNGRHNNPVRLSLRLYEADQIANPHWNGSLSNRDHDGVLLDDFGDVIGYSVLATHPGDSMPSPEARTVAAADMIHLLHRERPGQMRGAPEITPALPLYAMLRRFTLAVIAAAETAADLAAVIQTTQLPEDPDGIEPLDLIELHRRYAMTLPKGWTVEQLKAEHPSTTYKMFKREIIAEIARCLRMPYGVAAGDSSEYNFSSRKMEEGPYGSAILVERQGLEDLALDPVFGRWWQEARLIDGYLPETLRGFREPPAHTWRWTGRSDIEPLKERQADAAALQSHQTTLAELYSRRGLDWEEQLRQRAREIELMNDLGLITDIQPETFGTLEPPAGEGEETAAADAVFSEGGAA